MRPVQPDDSARLPVGTTVEDLDTDRIGQVMGYEGPYVQLRSLGGGREWDALPHRVRPVLAKRGPGNVVRISPRAHRRGGSAL